MMGRLLSLPTLLGIGAVAVAVAYGSGYLHGGSNARAKAQVAALSQAVTVLRERNEVEDEISNSDRVALCTSMGLSDADRDECVRRLAEADAKSDDGGDNHTD